jgi:hypothetical protein
MKPLPSADLTQEDLDAWDAALFRLSDTFGEFCGLYAMAAIADRRDADLMLHVEVAYGDIMHRGYPQWRIWHAACAFQGIPIPSDYCVYD